MPSTSIKEAQTLSVSHLSACEGKVVQLNLKLFGATAVAPYVPPVAPNNPTLIETEDNIGARLSAMSNELSRIMGLI
jgi:hypothetical protein